MNKQQQCKKERKVRNITLTPAVVKQEVNFLESSEISLHKTTVNLRKET